MRTTTPAPAGLPVYNNYCYTGLDTTVIETIPVALYVCNTNGTITFYNKAAAQLWGREPQAGTDKWCGAYKSYTKTGDPHPEGYNPLEQILKDGSLPILDEIIIERPDGTITQVLPHLSLIYDADGNNTGVMNMLIDVTQKRIDDTTMQQALVKKIEESRSDFAKSEERYHKMIDEVQDYAIILLDKEGVILNWNRGAQKIKGYTESEIVGKNFRMFYLHEDRIKKLPEKLIEEAIANGRAEHEGWRMRRDGTAFWGSIVITALHGSDNEIIGFSKVTRDLTEKKLNEDRLRSYSHDIEFRNKQLEEYAYIASHDLQEPLRKIQVFSEMLMDDLDDKEYLVKYINKISASAERMTSLIKDVLKYSQLSATDELFEEVNLNILLQNVIEDFELLIEQKRVNLTVSPMPVLKGIPIQLQQLFSNLLSNAIKFTDMDAMISIIAQNPTEDDIAANPLLGKDIPFIKIVVKDDGYGFEQEYAEQVFKMFKRLDNTPGTGIGLALCKRIAENHKGNITAKSEPGKGAEFNIFLPFIQIV